MSKKIRTEAVDHLFEAILCLKDKEECYTFFEDVCTINELLSLSQRFEVAKMLMDKRTYLDISEKTGASTATISRVNRSLNYGNDGYEMVFSRTLFVRKYIFVQHFANADDKAVEAIVTIETDIFECASVDVDDVDFRESAKRTE